eukprot:239771-Prymnesium_polylepis.1
MGCRARSRRKGEVCGGGSRWGVVAPAAVSIGRRRWQALGCGGGKRWAAAVASGGRAACWVCAACICAWARARPCRLTGGGARDEAREDNGDGGGVCLEQIVGVLDDGG